MIKDHTRALSALNSLDAGCTHEEWVRLGMALKSGGLPFEVFHEWSKSGHNYVNEKDCRIAWDSFNILGGITIATLFREAKLNGWKDTIKLESINNNFIKCPDNSTESISNEKALHIWESCIPAPPQHGYIHRKQGACNGLKVYPYDAPELIILGRNVYGYLVVPCWDNSKLQTLQFIPSEKGSKLNLPHASFGDGYFMVGSVKNTIYICEGLGQAWAVNTTGEAAAVCFGAGRMMRVAKKLRNEYPKTFLIILSDRGKEEQSANIAQAVNGMFVHMPEDKPQNYDINDYLKDFGEVALKDLVKNPKKPHIEQKESSQNLSLLLTSSDAGHGTKTTKAFTELGNALRMLDDNADTVKYIPEIKKWIIWSDSSWKWDDSSAVRAIAAKLPLKIYAEGSAYMGESELFAKWARKSQELRIMNASITLLSDFPEIRLSLSSIDTNNFLIGINEARGVIDLQKGIGRPSLPSDYVTKSLGAKAIGDASKAIRWIQFLEQIFENDYEVIDWMKRFCGYLLTGSTQEQIFLFCFGYGANGKSVFAELLKEIMGDYSTVIAWETLSENRRQAGSATPDLVTLIGKRFGICSETEDNRVLAEGLVKGVVSGDSMTVRPLYVQPIEFKPSCKLVITGNHKPIIRGNDNGIWRRVRLVPFNRTFSPEERDPHLLMKLKDEIPHILAWMIQGCLDWQKKGLADTPKIIREATDCYQSDQDIIGTWLSERTTRTVNSEISSTDLYISYSSWCAVNGLKAASAVVFGRRLAERGFKVRQSNSKRLWGGLSLNTY